MGIWLLQRFRRKRRHKAIYTYHPGKNGHWSFKYARHHRVVNYVETATQKFVPAWREGNERDFGGIQKRTNTWNTKPEVFLPYITSALLLFRISAFKRIKSYAEMWTCKFRPFIKIIKSDNYLQTTILIFVL